MDFSYQKYYLEQIKKHQSSILVWFRQSGKSDVSLNFVVDYLLKNTNKNIFFCINNKQSYQGLNRKLLLKLNSNPLNPLPNNNKVFFKWNFNYDTILGIDNIDVFIYDNFEYMKNVDLIDIIIQKWNPKIILTTSQFTTEAITYLDRYGDYYLSVVSYSSVATDKEVRIDNFLRDKNAYQIQHEYGNIEELYSGLGIKKNRSLIDVWGIKAQRRKKLEEIAKKIKEN